MKSIRPIDRFRIYAQENFKCWKCGACCINSDPITIYEEDIKDLAKFLKIPRSRIIKRYITKHDAEDGYKLKRVCPCGFLDTRTMECKVYPARPIACRTYPFLSTTGMLNGTVGYEDCPGSVEFVKAFNEGPEVGRRILNAVDLLPDDQRKIIDDGLRRKAYSHFKGRL